MVNTVYTQYLKKCNKYSEYLEIHHQRNIPDDPGNLPNSLTVKLLHKYLSV